MSKVLLAVNTLAGVNSQVYASHLNLAYRIGKDTGDEFLLFNAARMSIDRFRNEAGKYALSAECDYLMFLDDDVAVPRDTYTLLKEADVDVATPLVYIRGYPFKPMMFKAIGLGEETGLTTYDDWESVIELQTGKNFVYHDKPHLLECAAIGFSCALIKVDLLRKVPPAWFVTGTNHTEDVYFCVKARQILENAVSIFVDTRIHAGHLLDPEFICLEMRDKLIDFYDSCNPEFAEREKGRKGDAADRKEGYFEKNINIVRAAPITVVDLVKNET